MPDGFDGYLALPANGRIVSVYLFFDNLQLG